MRDNNGVFSFIFGLGKEDVREKVILTSFIPADKFVLPGSEKKVFKGRIYSGVNTENYTVIKVPMGQALAGDSVLFLGNTKVKELVYAGSAGGLGRSRVGDILICKNAFAGGGFSDNYPPLRGMDNILEDGKIFNSSGALLEKIRLSAEKDPGMKDIFKEGSIFTVSSLFAETPENLEKIERRAFDGIDMELSAVYHAAVVAGIEAAGILFVSDLPRKKPFWEKPLPGEMEKIRMSSEKVIELAMLTARGPGIK